MQENQGHDPKTAWSWALGLSAATMALLAIYHLFVLPKGSVGVRAGSAGQAFVTFGTSCVAFFQKKKIRGMLAFVFLFRSAEGLLPVGAPLFMQAEVADGGLGLSLKQKGVIGLAPLKRTRGWGDYVVWWDSKARGLR